MAQQIHNQMKSGSLKAYAAAYPKTVYLSAGEVRRLQRTPHTIRLIAGRAWISVNGQDIVLVSGDEVCLAASRYPAVISSLNKRPAVYEIL
jgi:hypothetical protein